MFHKMIPLEKTEIKKKLVLIGCLAGIAVMLPFFCSARNENQIKFTTYYPRPAGVYQELRSRQLQIGEPEEEFSLLDGQIKIGKSLIYNPQAELPHTGSLGELIYFSGQNGECPFFFWDGQDWSNLSSGSGQAMGCFKVKEAGPFAISPNPCPTDQFIRIPLSEWGHGTIQAHPYGAEDHYFSPNSQVHGSNLGNTYLCCQLP